MIARGYCQCGCGGVTRDSNHNRSDGREIKGEPRSYLVGHSRRGRFRDVESFFQKTEGCWVWSGRRVSGYGSVQVGREGPRKVYRRAHVLMYERYVGPIPAGLELDHLCRNRACVNPGHLEAVSHQENIRRAKSTRLNSEAAKVFRATKSGNFLKVARIYGFSMTHVRSVAAGKYWPASGTSAGSM